MTMETTRERNASRAVQRASIGWPRGVPMVAWEERRRGGVVHVSRCTHNYLSSRIKTTEPSHCLGHLIHRAQLSTATLGRCYCTSFSCLLRLVILLRVLEIKGTPAEIIIRKYKKTEEGEKRKIKKSGWTPHTYTIRAQGACHMQISLRVLHTHVPV